jgi:hypothetical protein
MPRRTNDDYLQAHDRLKRYWQHAQAAYACLTPAEQWQLHDYFQPTKKMSDTDRLTHRAAITAERPALPQQAGRALAKLDNAAVSWALRQQRAAQPHSRPAKRRPNEPQHIRVGSIVHPEIDAQAFTALLVDLAFGKQGPPAQPGAVQDLVDGITYLDPGADRPPEAA